MLTDSRRDRQVFGLSLMAFICIGTVTGLLGLAWPTMQQTFHLQQDDIGWLLASQIIGYMLSSFFSGRLLLGLGTGRALLAGAVVLTLGLTGVALAPLWSLAIVAGLARGFGSGLIDAGLNNYVSSYYGAREMNWLHASFGVGLVAGSAALTAILAGGLSWRLGYGASAAANLILAVVLAATLKLWRNGLPQQGMHADAAHAPLGETLRLPMLWLSLALIFAYAGIESSRGTWVYSVLTSARGMDESSAGLWVTISLAGFTLGRIIFGFIGDRVPRTTQLHVSMVAAIAGTLLLWWNPAETIGIFGLLLFSFAQAPMFALLVLGTSSRVGARHTASTIGIQMSAAGAGAAIVPALGGVLAEKAGLTVILPFFVVVSVVLYALYGATLVGKPSPPSPLPQGEG